MRYGAAKPNDEEADKILHGDAAARPQAAAAERRRALQGGSGSDQMRRDGRGP